MMVEESFSGPLAITGGILMLLSLVMAVNYQQAQPTHLGGGGPGRPERRMTTTPTSIPQPTDGKEDRRRDVSFTIASF